MFELGEEKLLMSSPDKSVWLTTHRIIYESGKGREQVMLEDVESCQFLNSSVGSYGVALVVVSILTFLIILNTIIFYIESRPFLRQYPGSFWQICRNNGLLYSFLLLLITHFFYRISRRYIIRVNGKFNSIDIRVKTFKHPSIRKMIHVLTEQSAKMKARTQTN
ncbi:MAG: hypothetical protein ABIT05_05045 [Chitinophagaceae bacterium]